MVTLGFGFKSYLTYRYRLKKQKQIQKSNDFYTQLIANALPSELKFKCMFHHLYIYLIPGDSSSALDWSKKKRETFFSLCNILINKKS